MHDTQLKCVIANAVYHVLSLPSLVQRNQQKFWPNDDIVAYT